MLIGVNNSFLGLAEQVIEAGPHLPVATATKLSWVAYGPTRGVESIARICHISEGNNWKEVHKLVQDYFSIENFGVKATDMVLESDDDKRARKVLEEKTRKSEGRYETGLLWKCYNTVLPCSFEMARQRLVRVEKKMQFMPPTIKGKCINIFAKVMPRYYLQMKRTKTILIEYGICHILV